MKVTFLGTGAAIPSKKRNLQSICLNLTDSGEYWLFDCGEATQHRILHTPIKLSKISKIFITHLHGDHLFGLPGLLGSRSFADPPNPLTILGPSGIKEFVNSVLRLSGTNLRYPIDVVEVKSGLIYSDDTHTVTTEQLEHGLTCLGYRIAEKNRPGRLLVEKLTAKNIPPGPLYAKIKQGKNLLLPDGTKLLAKDFLGPPKPGKSVAILGDTRFCGSSVDLAQKADLLIHEATFADEHSDQAGEYYHSTGTQAAQIARDARAKSLILTHVSSRYTDHGQSILNEAKKVFPNTFLATDLAVYQLTKGSLRPDRAPQEKQKATPEHSEQDNHH